MSNFFKKIRIMKGMALIEVMLVFVIVLGFGAFIFPVYQKYSIRYEFQEAVSDLSVLKQKIFNFMSRYGHCPRELGNTIKQSRLIISYSLKEESKEFFSSCLIKGRLSPVSHVRLKGNLIKLKGEQTAQGSFLWMCSSNVERIFLPSWCVFQQEIEFP